MTKHLKHLTRAQDRVICDIINGYRYSHAEMMKLDRRTRAGKATTIHWLHKNKLISGGWLMGWTITDLGRKIVDDNIPF